MSGGFAVVQPNSVLSINAVEAYPMADFSAEAVREAIADAQKGASSATEHEAAEAKIELEVCPPSTPSSPTLDPGSKPMGANAASRSSRASRLP